MIPEIQRNYSKNALAEQHSASTPKEVHNKLKKARFSPKVPYFLSSPLGSPPRPRQTFYTEALVKQQLLSCPFGFKAPVPSSAAQMCSSQTGRSSGGYSP